MFADVLLVAHVEREPAFRLAAARLVEVRGELVEEVDVRCRSSILGRARLNREVAKRELPPDCRNERVILIGNATAPHTGRGCARTKVGRLAQRIHDSRLEREFEGWTVLAVDLGMPDE